MTSDDDDDVSKFDAATDHPLVGVGKREGRKRGRKRGRALTNEPTNEGERGSRKLPHHSLSGKIVII